MKLRFALSGLLCGLVYSTSAGAVTLTGSVNGSVRGNERLSLWAVTPFGQPVQELATVESSNGKFSLNLPEVAPQARVLAPVDDKIAWPGLIDFESASAPAQATELKLFAFADLNGNRTREPNEPIRELRVNVGKSDLFLVWSSAETTVKASKGYEAQLKKGWNVLTVDVRNTVKVQPLDLKANIQIELKP